MTRGLAATERIVFGSAVTNPFTRHLTVTASGFGTLAQDAPGPRDRSASAAATARCARWACRPRAPRCSARRTCARCASCWAAARCRLERHRRAPALGHRGPGSADHALGHRAEEPAPGRRGGRSRDALRGRLRRGGAMGHGLRPCGRGRLPVATRGREDLDPARDARVRGPAGRRGRVPLVARRLREPHRRHGAQQPRQRHARA